jgi:RNA polymerase sigma factor (TIGR02999 family)
MTLASKPELTELLRRASAGDRDAANAAYAAVYDELRRIARILLRGEATDHTLDAEGLLHEAYLRVSGGGAKPWVDRSHFLAVMSRAMRRLLIDHGRRKHALKRGRRPGRVPLTGIVLTYEERAVDLIALHEALDALEARHPESAQIVELTYFVGLTAEEVAAATGSSVRSVGRELQFARAFLLAEIEG